MEIYISTDIESDGPIPGKFSMLNFGSVALNLDKTVLSTFSANLKPLRGAIQDAETMNFWSKNTEVWNIINTNPEDPEMVMLRYLQWLKDLEKIGKLVFVGYPLGFDFSFIRWYLINFTGECPFGYQGLDIKSYAMAILKTKFTETTKSKFNKNWFEKDLPHTHLGLDDALEQGMLFINILNSNN